ncbi:MAG: radical SAM/SPASM domain-containing protein [Thermoanaerobaculum sp.]
MRGVLDIRTAKVAVELTNRCNLRCGMCPMNKLGRPDADMPWWLVEKVAAEFARLGIRVKWLHEMGEPLLYPRICEAIDLFPGCSVSTNAMLLDEEASRALLATSLRRIRLCIDTINPRVYPFIRRGGIFEEVVANIRTFLELSKGKPITVEIQRMITTQTAHESVRDFVEFFNLERYPQAKVIEKTCEPLDTSDETPLHESFYGCFQGYPFSWFIVLADGRVTHCCYDAHGQQCIGDLKTQTVEEILESVRLPEMMAAFRARDWRALPRCGECYKHAEGRPPFYDFLIATGRKLERSLPVVPLARRLINR